MKSIKDIQSSVETELSTFQTRMKDSLRTDAPLLDKIIRYILKRKGKRVRPLLVFLSAKAFGEVNDATYNAATLIEILHTATLVHDDVVDEAEKRRGFFSINALWKSKVAVLVGDFLLSKGLIMALENKEYTSLQLLSEAVRDMSEGELMQIKKSRTLDITEEEYFEIIRRKTASLIGVATAAGAASTTDDQSSVDAMKRFGHGIGMAFQIKDDLFDYGQDNVGKPLGLDVKQKKMTLPLIYTISQVDRKVKRKLIRIVKSDNPSKEQLRHLSHVVSDSGGLDYARKKMLEYRDKALEEISIIPESRSKVDLLELSDYIVERNI
ncbi:MAG: polyprenyl synthetase family protein [Saprospiraceae bacterium]|nr:polyprenyl synthetase family protein [Saprospiraceae bacterium]